MYINSVVIQDVQYMLWKIRAITRALGMASSTVSDEINYKAPRIEKTGRPRCFDI